MQEQQRATTKLLQVLRKERKMATKSILLDLNINFDYYKNYDCKLDTSSSYVCYLFSHFKLVYFLPEEGN